MSGDKSEVLEIDSPDMNMFPEFVKAVRYECVLEPGDLLFIPGKTIVIKSQLGHSQKRSVYLTSVSQLLTLLSSVVP